MDTPPLFTIPFLASRWESKYNQFCGSDEESALLTRLKNWANRDKLRESSSESAFIHHFFRDTWGYTLQAEAEGGEYQCYQQFPVARAGAGGGTGAADLALGYFGSDDGACGIPQVLCEFKDIRSGLDQKQNRKGADRTPVRQCLDYLREARAELTGNELVEPAWGIVTDMNEFRLYRRISGNAEYQRFVIEPAPGDETSSLLEDSESGAFLRFLFYKMFRPECLLSRRGPSHLERMLEDQLIHEGEIEKEFYLEYKAYREHLYETIVSCNPDFPGTRGRLVHLTQRLLDRCLFVLFCEDMGQSLSFPTDLLRSVLINFSTDPYYNPDDYILWERLKLLFKAMGYGGTFGDEEISEFNGGLYEDFPELERLKIPTKVFCARNQGAGGMDTLLKHPKTLLYFSAKYNFGISGPGHERVIDFYALGRIFEQSITELEIMEAEAEGRPSINKLSKRKRNGVYYTPEWVTQYIVEETVGAWLRDRKKELNLTDEHRPDKDDVEQYKVFLHDRRHTAPVGSSWDKALQDYRDILEKLKVVDPACGSGAFLVQALTFLKEEYNWVAKERERLSGLTQLWDTEAVIKSILANNIYGVDINAESVEITKLALWMHTAGPGQKLSKLDENILCGNSLVGPDFYRGERQMGLFSEEERELINVFDWRAAFPGVFARGGFDCVVGNPPYVKLQNFAKVQSDVAEYLVEKTRPDGSPLYESTQTGNFDMYLPFIEKGIELLNGGGRMGYIAPNVWLKNEYGRGLRQKLKETQQLDRWIDFKSYQIFEEAITYTALQFFEGSPVESVLCMFASDGEISHVNWDEPEANISYNELPQNDAWDFIPNSARKLIHRLSAKLAPLGEKKWTKAIFQGIKTGCDSAFVLGKSTLKKENIEKKILKQLVSGSETKRYKIPQSEKHLIFPYNLGSKNISLFSEGLMAEKYPNTLTHFKKKEKHLRNRESGRFDDEEWYCFSRPQNLKKLDKPKILLAGTAPGLRAFCDEKGKYSFLGGRVYGLLPTCENDLFYLLGLLNSKLLNFIFQMLARPKSGGFYDIETQYLAPLPIPDPSKSEKEEVIERAKTLQDLHTRRRDLVQKFDKRLNSPQTKKDKRQDRWLWADIGTVTDWKKSPEAPSELKGRELSTWAKRQRDAVRDGHYEELDARLHAGALLTIENTEDELHLKIDGCPVLTRYDDPDTELIAAQWRHALRDLNLTESFNAKKLVKLLTNLRTTDHEQLRDRLIEIDAEIQTADVQIEKEEIELNELVYGLYGLCEEEVRMVEAE